MSRVGIYLAIVACFLLNSIAPSEAALSCQDATAATVNGSLLLGTWFEAARKPIGGGNNTEECIQMVINYKYNTVSADITYSTAPHLWINQTTSTDLQVKQPYTGNEMPQVFTGVFYLLMNGVNTTLKILETDYISYMLSCAYTTPINLPSTTTEATSTSASSTTSSSSTASTASTSSSTVSSSSTTTPVPTTTEAAATTPAGAFILTRERQVTQTILSSLMKNASLKFSDFVSLSNVTQSSECYTSGAKTTMPFLAAVLAMLFTLMKIVC